MHVFTDNTDFARQLCPDTDNFVPQNINDFPQSLKSAAQSLFAGSPVKKAETKFCPGWPYLFAVERAPASQLELLAGLKDLPDKLLCMADSGLGFKGFRNRSWAAETGNLHLTVHLSPGRKIEKFSNGFTILAAISVLQALDQASGHAGHYQIRWINDIVSANKKVAGVLTRSQLQGEIITGVQIGIGINVHTVPSVPPDIFVPAVTSVESEFTTSLPDIFQLLCRRLDTNYKNLITGGYDLLWQEYRSRSIVTGKNVTLYSDPYNGPPEKIISGVVTAIGQDLELFFDHSENSYSKGRVVIQE